MLLYDKDGKHVGEVFDDIKVGGTSGKRVALCVGHNPSSQGAVGSSGMSEYDFNMNFLGELLPYLPPTHEYKVFMRKNLGSYSAEQNDLLEQITEWGGCDIAMEFHFNASVNADINGHEILYLTENGKALAEKLDKCFDVHLDNNDRNIKRRNSGNGYGFLKRGTYTSLIVEPFFAANQHDFMSNGNLRQPLIAAYKEFFANL